MENPDSSNNLSATIQSSSGRSETEPPAPAFNAELVHRTPPRIRVRRFESLSSGPPNLLSPNAQAASDEPPRFRVRILGEMLSLSTSQFRRPEDLNFSPGRGVNAAPYSILNAPVNSADSFSFQRPNVPLLPPFVPVTQRINDPRPPSDEIRNAPAELVIPANDSRQPAAVVITSPARSTGMQNVNLEPLPRPADVVEVINLEDETSNDVPSEEMETDGELENEAEVQQPVQVNNPRPSTSAAATALDNTDDGDAGSLCAICYSPYTNSGDHRITCLKCGHLFGESCIKRWLKRGCQNNKRCPSCNSKASLREIRTIFAANIVALDTTEKDKLLERLNQLQNEKNHSDYLLSSEKFKNEQLTKTIEEYESKIRELQANGNQREQKEVAAPKISSFSSKIHSTSVLCSEEACRVLAYTSQLSLLLASQAAASLVPSYGVRKINVHDMRPTSYQHIHKQPIRDMSFSPFECGHLLTVSLDCTAKLFDTHNNVVVQSFTTPQKLWSCAWSSVDSNKFFCGCQNGTWFAFDKRQPKPEPQQIVEGVNPNDKSGILSLCHIPPRPGRFMPNGGVIACRLNQIVAHYPIGDEYVKKVLPMEGPFMSMEYNRRNDHLLISAKASKNRWNTSRHMVCQLSESAPSNPGCDGIDVLHTFNGSPLSEVLSRSTFVSLPNGDLTVCAYNQRNANVDLWSIGSGTRLSVNDVHLPEPVYDIASFSVDDKNLIIPCLSAKKLSVIKLSF